MASVRYTVARPTGVPSRRRSWMRSSAATCPRVERSLPATSRRGRVSLSPRSRSLAWKVPRSTFISETESQYLGYRIRHPAGQIKASGSRHLASGGRQREPYEERGLQVGHWTGVPGAGGVGRKTSTPHDEQSVTWPGPAG